MARYPKPHLWKPKNPEKYIGDASKIISRSSWETRVFSYLDRNKNVIAWNSEDVVVKYLSPVDGRIHNYHLDIFARIKNRQDQVVNYALEIKPAAQMLPPKPTPSKKQKVLLEEIETYQINQAKWNAAKTYFESKGVIFLVLNEYDIGLKKRK